MRRESLQADRVERDGAPSARAETGLDLFLAPTAAYLIVAIVLGGSSTMLVPGAALDLAALPLLAASGVRLAYRGLHRQACAPLILAALAVLVPLLQLIPTPVGFWVAAPGRAAIANALDLAHVPLRSAPISLAPDGTWVTLFGLMPPLAVFCAGLSLGDRERRVLAACVAAAAFVSIALFVFQRSGGEGRALFGVLDLSAASGAAGVFANRNHQATLLAAAVPFAILVATRMRIGDWRLPAAVGLAVSMLLVVGAIVTTSRAAFILGPIAVVLGLGVALAQRSKRSRAWFSAVPIAALAGASALALAVAVAMKVAPVAARFDAAGASELRLSLFPIVARAGLDFAPFGAGLGAFSAIYPAYEPSALIGPAFVNHAHNEFLELWLEAGVPGLILLVGFLGWLGWAALGGRGRADGPERATVAAGVAVIVLILIHSLVDYPLRTPAMAAVFGLACAMAAGPREDIERRRGGRVAALRAVAAAIVIVPAVAALGWLCFSHGASSYYDQQDPMRALRWNARNPQALASLAEQAFGRSAEGPQARSLAAAASRRVLAVAPLDVGSYRRLGLLAEADGRPTDARALMLVADHRSRRDDLTQVWLLLDDLKRADFDAALAKTDLVQRQWWQLSAVTFPEIAARLDDVRLREAVARSLARAPDWRPGFLRTLAYDDATVWAARDIHGRLRAMGAPPTPYETETLVSALVDRGRFEEARDEWAKSNGRAPAEGVYDGDFRGLPGSPPFNWRFVGTTAPIMLDDGSPALGARGSAQDGGLLAEQVLGLAPGGYVLKVSARGGALGDAGPAGAFEWRLTCLRHDPNGLATLPVTGLSPTWGVFSASFVVEPGCVAQRLQLYSLGRQDGGDAYFRGVVTEPGPTAP